MATRLLLKVLLNAIQVQPMELSKQRQSHLLRFIRVLDDLKTKKIPLVLAFLPKKVQIIKSKATKRFSPIFLTDYQKRFTAAVRDFSPEAQPLCCHFYYCLAVFKRFQKLQLATEYRQDQKFAKNQRLFTLLYLPIGLELHAKEVRCEKPFYDPNLRRICKKNLSI